MTTRTRPSTLLVAAVAAGLVVNLLVGLAYGDLPPLPALAGVTLALLGIAEGVVASVLRARIRRRAGARPVDPLAAARAVALAKASWLTGALVGGAWLGVLAFVVPRGDDLAAAASDSVAAIVGALGSAVLVAGALWLEHCCRTPEDPRGPDADPPSGAPRRR